MQRLYKKNRMAQNSPHSSKPSSTLPTTENKHQLSQLWMQSNCSVHGHENITHMCVDCEWKCLCALCLKQGDHRMHGVRTIEKSARAVDRMLNEWVIRLRSKSDILALLHECLHVQKAQLYQQFMEIKQQIQFKFTTIVDHLQNRKQQILLQVKDEEDFCIDKLELFTKQVINQSSQTIQLMEVIRNSVENMQPTMLCLFFSHHKNIIENAALEDSLHKIKKQLPELKAQVDFFDFEAVVEKIKHMGIFPSNKKPKKSMKNPKKPRQSFPGICKQQLKETKCTESKKDLVRFFRSPTRNNRRGCSSGKIMSMPSSQDKESRSKNPSPCHNHGEQFKKKARKGKK